MDTPIFINLNTIPLNQYVNQSHRVSAPALEVRPGAMHHFLEMTDQSQQRQNCFNGTTNLLVGLMVG
jgi:hypothetical protein